MRRADFLRLGLGTALVGAAGVRTASGATTEWTLACEQEGSGRIRSGSLEAAARAVGRGADLCVYTTPSHRQFEESIPLLQTYWNVDGAFAGFWSAPTAELLTPDDSDLGGESFYAYSPAGASRIYWGSKGVSERVMPRAHYLVYRWFVRDCWTVAWEIDAGGHTLSGSLEQVREAVRRGLGIKVGVKDLFDADAGSSKVPEHWTFVESVLNLAYFSDAEAISFATRRSTLVGGKWPLRLEAASFHPARMRVRTTGEIGLAIETFPPLGHTLRRMRRAIRVLTSRA